MKYFCITEAIALYLQKFIVYRKRKIFYGEDGTVNSMLEVIAKHKTKEKYIVPVNDICRAETLECLEKNGLEYTEVMLYKTVINDVKDLLKKRFKEYYQESDVFYRLGKDFRQNEYKYILDLIHGEYNNKISIRMIRDFYDVIYNHDLNDKKSKIENIIEKCMHCDKLISEDKPFHYVIHDKLGFGEYIQGFVCCGNTDHYDMVLPLTKMIDGENSDNDSND
jgi:hypothetical protein